MVAQVVKNLPTTQEMWVQYLGRDKSLEKGMATHSSILVWRIPWTEQPDGLYSPWGHKERHDRLIKTFKEVKKIMLKN